MEATGFGQFLISVLVFTTIGFMLAMMVTPPDPVTQIVAIAALLPLVIVGSYLLTYRIGYEWL